MQRICLAIGLALLGACDQPYLETIPAVANPLGFAYAESTAVYVKGTAIAANAPSATAVMAASFSVSPALPAGLSLNVTTGAISGTPSAVCAQASYTVTATNSGGSTTTTLTITVIDVPPTNLSYTNSPVVYTKGVVVAANVPANSGGTVTAYSCSSPLPAGLSLDAMSGVISGTPTVLSPESDYLVTATNTGGATTASLTITVNDAAPADLVYTSNPAVYTKDSAIVANDPFNTGGVVTLYAVNPPLPANLSLDALSGVISGTPIGLSPQATYTVTATNTGGFTTASLSITVNDVPPSALTYSSNPAVYTRAAIVPNTPASSGGPVISYAIAPALPAGLSLSSTTGEISGTPSILVPRSNYTVTATNTGGSTSATLTITVTNSGAVVVGENGSIAAGSGHTCALVNGGVQCWGANNTGQLGNNGTTGYSGTPVPVLGLDSGAQAIAAGQFHACAVVNGGVQCWGQNGVGALGNNTTTDSPVPVQVQGLTSGAQAVGAGVNHSCALVNGGVQCWGRNPFGQLGSGTTTSSAIPTPVVGLATGVQAISVGGYHTCALVHGGTRCWGYNAYGQLGNNSTIDSSVPVVVQGLATGPQALAAGYYHTCALVDGSARCWGFNGNGELGNNSTVDSYVPVGTQGLSSGVQAVAAGEDHGCALVNGAMQCWGFNGDGQLGDGSTTDSLIPVPVQGLGNGVQAISTGALHTCALVNGAIQCWGFNGDGQLGDTTVLERHLPVPVQGLTSGLQAVFGGGVYRTCVLFQGGAQCWGDNVFGELGNNSTVLSNVPVPVQGLATGVQAIAQGQFHTCALVNGGMECWGWNAYGQLGDNTTANRHTPVPVQGLTSGVQAMTGAQYHTCALVNGGAQCWGLNELGQLGDDSTIDSPVPVPVYGLASGVQALALGGQVHSCALVNGGAQCWGYNGDGELGDGSTISSSVPVQVLGLTSGVQAIANGDYHTCALVNGGVLCWGSNGAGQLGNGMTADSPVPIPVQVLGLTRGVQAIAEGHNHGCALVDGGMQCWGLNNFGELGDDSTIDRNIATQVFGLASGVQEIAAGGAAHTCALVMGGAQCWGYGGDGQLGNGSTDTSLVSVEVLGF